MKTKEQDNYEELLSSAKIFINNIGFLDFIDYKPYREEL
jgi:hypothetical protein